LVRAASYHASDRTAQRPQPGDHRVAPGPDAHPGELASQHVEIVGVLAAAPGDAYQSLGGEQAGLPSGGVQGTFATDVNDLYAFKWPASFVPFDTQAPGSTATQNRITVAGQTFVSANVTDPNGGWHLVWLDGDTLKPRGNFTFSNCFGAAPCAGGLLAQFQTILNDPTPGLIILTTIRLGSRNAVSLETEGGIQQAAWPA
jgi:hypothetical protein